MAVASPVLRAAIGRSNVDPANIADLGTIAALDAAQQAGLQQEWTLAQPYFTPNENAFPGVAVDPAGDAGRKTAEESASVAGDLFPLDQRLTDSAGACVDLRERLRRGPLIVVFFRGTWCTLCSLALRHLSQCLPMFLETYGADLVAVSGQTPEHNHACEASNQLGFPIYCDEGFVLASRLGITYNLTQQESRFYDFLCKPSFEKVYGSAHGFRLPLPATFVLAQGDGRIGYAFVDQDLSKRSRLLRIEAALQDLTGVGMTTEQCQVAAAELRRISAGGATTAPAAATATTAGGGSCR